MATPYNEVKVDGRSLRLSNLDKVYYPATGFTKADVLGYYARIAPVMVPHLRLRPLNLKRYPDGVGAPHFFQKECPSNRPAWLATVPLWSETKGATITFCSASNAASLVWLANAGNLEFHTLLLRKDSHEQPTLMVYDLDPGDGAGLLESASVALLVKDDLQDAGLRCWAKVSGGKGMQAYVPLNTPTSFEAARAYALAVAERLHRLHPAAIVANMRKDLRKGKILIDYSQNSRHKSTVSVYSLRAQSEPTVSAPVSWQEVEIAVAASEPERLRFLPDQVLRRVRRSGDLFAEVLAVRQHLPGREASSSPARKRTSSPRKPRARRASTPRSTAPRTSALRTSAPRTVTRTRPRKAARGSSAGGRPGRRLSSR